MAKSSPKKKVNRKLKRSVRKSFAAMLMITAIIVAAIPVPENVASNGSSSVAKAAVNYEYPSADIAQNDMTIDYGGIDLSGPKGTTIMESLGLRKGTDNKWQLNWQFKFYESNGKGVICEYNSTYAANVVTLNANIKTEYEIVQPDIFEKFYTVDMKDKSYTLRYDDYANGLLGDETKNFFQKYVPAAYETFIKDCDKYTKDKAAWDAMSKEEQDKNTEPAKPKDIVKNINKTGDSEGLTNEQKLQFYCDYTEATTNHKAGGYPGATLTEVFDKRGGTTANPIIYMPKGATNKENLDDSDGPNGEGFWYVKTGTKSVNAIGKGANGKGAFEGVQNVETLTIPSEITYIGDDAFLNSFIKEVNLTGITAIGNRAFKNCNRLDTATLPATLVSIGNEAFNNTAIKTLVFPTSATQIGAGAFAFCMNLASIDLSAMTTEGSKVGRYAFYDCPALNSVSFGQSKIREIGEGAFALQSGQTGTLDTFTFPNAISKQGDLGDFLLAGRGKLKTVVMPADYGRSTAVELPENFLYNCINLGTLEFPADGAGSSGLVTFKETMFDSIINSDFYVRGPELDNSSQIAAPRKSTWATSTTVQQYVPYVYTKNGVDYYEISKDNYLLAGNSKGELTSCTLKDASITTPLDLIIPSKVGGYDIKTLAPGCIGDDVKKYLRSVEIEDDSLATVADNVFSNCPNLEKVEIGNSVKSIGASAFKNCPELEDVTFHTPANNDYTGFTIGSEAFATGSKELTFRGDIVSGYAPFEWAMAKDNLIDNLTGKRVCYKSIEPYRMTVMRDNESGEVTLLDYPKLKNLDQDNQEYCDEMKEYYHAKYKDDPAYKDQKDNCSGLADEKNHGPWCDNYTYSILENYQRDEATHEWETISPREQAMIDATRNIVVPDGITSIDVAGYLKSNKNNVNIVAYLTSGNHYPKGMYQTDKLDGKEEVVPGLFSGLFEDFGGILPDEQKKFETSKKGNDAVRSITLKSVKSLPDYAFDDCEQLESVDLGSCTDIGTAPFRGCDNLTSVGGNEKYSCENGIIYSNDSDGTLKIEECLPARGMLVGESIVSPANDPKLPKVGHIAEGAFEDCNYVVRVYFNESENLKVIPKYCFRNCDKLTEVVLPAAVNEIQEKAFENVTPLSATIYGKEVSIRDDAFLHDPTIEIRSYKESAAITYAKNYGLTSTIIEEGFKVDFLDYDGTYLAKTQYVESGKQAVVPNDPKRDGHTFTGWSSTVPNMSVKNITADAAFIAQYNPNSSGGGNTGGGNNNGNNNGNNGSGNGTVSGSDSNKTIFTVTVVNGSGSGTYAKGTTVTITANPPSTGKKFDRWETSSLNVSMANVTAATTTFKMPENNVTVTAVYDLSNGTGGSTGGSSSGSGSNGAGSSGGGSSSGAGTTDIRQGTSGTTVTITNPGISNTDKASASVEGSTDNFIVRISETAEAAAAVEQALTKEFGSLDNILYFPMDISLYDSTGTTKIADTTGLTVNITVPIPDDLIAYAGNNKAGAVVGDNSLEKLNATFKTIDGIPCISFKATHFSPYTVYVDTQNLTAAMDTSPKTGDPIHPKWFLAIGLGCLSVVLYMKKDRKNLKIA